MAVKRSSRASINSNYKKQKTTLSNHLINNLPIFAKDDEKKANEYLTIPQSGVFEASLIRSIKTILYNPVIFKKYFHKVKDNSNRNVSIRIFFLRISHLKDKKEQAFNYFKPFLEYYHLTQENPDDEIIIDNLPKETLQQSMNGSMHRLVDSIMKVNNFHHFKVRLYIVKNQQVEADFVEDQQRSKQLIQEQKEKEREIKQKLILEKHEKMQMLKEQREKEKLLEKQERERIQKDRQMEKEKERLQRQQLMKEKREIKERLQEVDNEKTVIKSEKQIKLDEFKEKMNAIDRLRSDLRKEEGTIRREFERLFAGYSKKIAEFIALRKEHEKKVTKEDKDMKNKAETWEKFYQNKKMVYHLDKMAKENEEVNVLTTTLAAGKGTTTQVEQFRGYMEKAKSMAAVEDWQPANNYLQVMKFKELVFNMKELKKQKTDEMADKIKKNKEARHSANEEKGAVQKAREEYLQNYTELQRQKAAEKKAAQEKQAETKSAQSFVEPKLGENPVVKVEKSSKVKVENEDDNINEGATANAKLKPKPQKKKESKMDLALTSFQNKYTKKSDIVFEFSDNLNDRYLLPKDGIIEYDNETGLLRLSWISILNTKEIETKLGRAKKLAVDFDYETNMRQLYPLEILEASATKPVYTCNTIELSDIPLKYLPIIKANMNDYDEVYGIMKWIIANGKRVDMHDIRYTLNKNNEAEQEMAENFREEVYKYELSKSRQKK